MKIRDFYTLSAAQAFKAECERLGWTCSTITQDDGYIVLEDRTRSYVGQWHVSTNWPF